ncbi:MAG: hypothetical protein Tp138OMZ00d2C19078221_9 [Prokaryotic dsDNA virus sp.]|jgi:hypothetical protein|nr:hypothetical protein [Pseudomonadales bacterium]QDP67437.1 MAG: hypothetical protein Tp138OMZ00d2C19078221_9 [Prokaryotic dsDNA virus sp.]|tara:strand:- start:282 stop:689 length:408 start_codon:yes stop_codon:yes gene_type:complete
MKMPRWLPVYGDQSYRGDCPKEAAEQVTFFNQVRMTEWASVALHPRNEGKFTHAQVARMKAEGMLPGASDIIIIGSPVFCCELKRRDHTKSSWQPGQLEFLEDSLRRGAFVCVALGFEAAWEAFQEWILTQPPPK